MTLARDSAGLGRHVAIDPQNVVAGGDQLPLLLVPSSLWKGHARARLPGPHISKRLDRDCPREGPGQGLGPQDDGAEPHGLEVG